jgi:hypothetical protein
LVWLPALCRPSRHEISGDAENHIREAVQDVLRSCLESGEVDEKLTIRVDVVTPLANGGVHRQPASLHADKPVSEVMEAWCKHQDIALEDVDFSLDKVVLRGTETLASLGYKTRHFLFTDKVVELWVEAVDKEVAFAQGAGDEVISVAHQQHPVTELQEDGIADKADDNDIGAAEAMSITKNPVSEMLAGGGASSNPAISGLRPGRRFRSKTPDPMRRSQQHVGIAHDVPAPCEANRSAPSASSAGNSLQTVQKSRRRWKIGALIFEP